MEYFNSNLRGYEALFKTQELRKVKEEKTADKAEEEKANSAPKPMAPESEPVTMEAQRALAEYNKGAIQGLTVKPQGLDGAIGPNGVCPVNIEPLEDLINRWYSENETMSYDEKISLLTNIINHLDENSETFEADNRMWRTIRHTVYVQHRYEHFQGILDDPDFNPQTFDWDTVEWFGGENFPDGTTAVGLYDNGDEYGLPGIVWAIDENLIYNYHEQKIYLEYNVNYLRYKIAYVELMLQEPDVTDDLRATLQQVIAQHATALENNLQHLQNVTIGCEYEDKVSEWEANAATMTEQGKFALVNGILGLLGQMFQIPPVTAAIAHWTEIRDSLSSHHLQQQHEALK